jgi:hypothetical protein
MNQIVDWPTLKHFLQLRAAEGPDAWQQKRQAVAADCWHELLPAGTAEGRALP